METDGAEGEGKELMREVTKVRDVGRDISIGVGKIIQEPHSGHYEYYRTTFFFFLSRRGGVDQRFWVAIEA